jgi:hypothetical protein
VGQFRLRRHAISRSLSEADRELLPLVRGSVDALKFPSGSRASIVGAPASAEGAYSEAIACERTALINQLRVILLRRVRRATGRSRRLPGGAEGIQTDGHRGLTFSGREIRPENRGGHLGHQPDLALGRGRLSFGSNIRRRAVARTRSLTALIAAAGAGCVVVAVTAGFAARHARIERKIAALTSPPTRLFRGERRLAAEGRPPASGPDRRLEHRAMADGAAERASGGS